MSGPPLLVDALIIILFLAFALIKGHKGFYRSLMPLIVTIISVVGARVLTGLLTDAVTEMVYPWAKERLFSRMDLSGVRTATQADVSSQLGRLLPDVISNAMRRLELELRPFVEDAFRTAAPGVTAQSIAEDAVSALMLPVTRAAVRIVLFLMFFLLLKLVLSLFKNALGLAFDLPVIRGFDWLGGALIGIAWCAAVLWFLFWLTDLFAPKLFAELREGSRILAYVFAENK